MRWPTILRLLARHPLTSRWAFVTVGLAAGFSGLAVIATILTGIPLLIFEAVLAVVPVSVAVILIRRMPRSTIREIWRVVRAGILAGFVALLLYDVTRTILSQFDPSPYNPFEAIRHFGRGLVTDAAPLPVVMAAGLVIHVLNGCSFGVIYAVFGGRHVHTFRAAVLTGVAWGLTLEFIQSILYVGWLQITTVLAEFLLISALGHLVYGSSLGIGVRWILGRDTRQEERLD